MGLNTIVQDMINKQKKVKKICDIQCQEGNYSYDEYMRGMANGLILAVSILEDTTPVYKEAKNETK